MPRNETSSEHESETTAISDTRNARDNDILALKKCFEYFSKISGDYEKNNRLHARMRELNTRSGCLPTFLLFLLALLSYILSDYIPFPYSVFASITIVVVIIIALFIRKNINRKMTNNQINDTYELLKRHYERFENCPIGIAFSDPHIIMQLIHLIEIRRADSIKEAVNVYVEDVHRREVLSIQQQIAMNAERAANEASRAASNAADAASATRWNTTMNMWRD